MSTYEEKFIQKLHEYDQRNDCDKQRKKNDALCGAYTLMRKGAWVSWSDIQIKGR